MRFQWRLAPISDTQANILAESKDGGDAHGPREVYKDLRSGTRRALAAATESRAIVGGQRSRSGPDVRQPSIRATDGVQHRRVEGKMEDHADVHDLQRVRRQLRDPAWRAGGVLADAGVAATRLGQERRAG